MKPRILMVAMFPPPYSSGERIVNLTVQKMLEEKYTTDIINVSTGMLNPKNFGVKKISNQLTSLWLYIKAIQQIKRKLKENQYHAFYFVTPSSSFGHIRDFYMIKGLGRKAGKILAFIHNGNFDSVLCKKSHEKITRSFIDKVDKFVFLSEGLRQKATKYIDAAKCVVIKNSIDAVVTFNDEEIKRKINEYNGSLHIVYISNMNPTKGYMDLAVAVKILAERKAFINMHVDFVGEWLSEEQLLSFNSFITENKLDNIIKVHGKINDRVQIKAMLYQSNIFVLPTYFSQEAQPLSIIEALNAGTPVIATKHASIPEYIADGYNGFLVSKQAPEEIANAIEQLADITLWKTLAANARQSFTDQFSMEVYKQKMFNLFEQ